MGYENSYRKPIDIKMKFDFLYNTKRNIVIFLGVLAVFLILLFFYKRNKGDTEIVKTFTTSVKHNINPEELKKIFPSGIDSISALFGIKKEWIRDANAAPLKKQQKGKPDKKPETPINTNFFWFNKEITVPKDVSAAEINFEIKNFLLEYEFDCNGSEDPKTGNVTLGIFNQKDSSKKTIAQVIFIYSDKVRRDAADICMVFNKVEQYSKDDLTKLLSYSDRFAVVLPDMVDKIEAQAIVLDSKREYLLFLDIGDNNDLLSEFKPEMKEKEWKSKVRTISYEYDKAAGVIILNPKKVMPLEFDIISEFPKYNLKAFRDTMFVKYGGDESPEAKINTFFNDINVRTQKGAKSIIYLVNFSLKDFDIFKRESYKLKRKGFRFYGFNDIIKRRLKQTDTESMPQ